MALAAFFGISDKRYRVKSESEALAKAPGKPAGKLQEGMA